MHKTLDEHGKVVNELFIELFANFTLEVQVRIEQFPSKLEKLKRYYETQDQGTKNSQLER